MMVSVAQFVAALRTGRPQEAVEIARRFLATNAALGEQWYAVARFAAARGEWSVAREAIVRYAAIHPDDPERQLAYADIFARSGKVAEAAAALERWRQNRSLHPGIAHFLGTAFVQLGDRERGIAYFEEVLRVLPSSGVTWLSWANARTFTADDSRLGELQAACRAASDEARAPILYALGKAFDDIGDTDHAFAAISEGASLTSAERAYDAVSDQKTVLALINAYPPQRLVAAERREGPSGRSIFVTGLPRSGTTMIEQMLVSHSQVAEGGEVNLLALAAADVGGLFAPRVEERLAAGEAPPRAWQAFADRYEHLLRERFGSSGRIVDKSLNTPRFLGLLGQAMPSSPVIWLHRDPFDVAWSCFRTFFAQGVPWSFDLRNLAHHFALEDLLYHHWRDVLSRHILTVEYRDFVTAPGSEIRRILSHCGLESEPGVYASHQTVRSVTTASVDQVRKPIYTSGIGSAAPYVRHLRPFVDAYEAARTALGLPN